MKRIFAILLCIALFGITSQTQAHWHGGYWGGYGPYYGYGWGPGYYPAPYYGYGYYPNKGAAIAGTVLGALGI